MRRRRLRHSPGVTRRPSNHLAVLSLLLGAAVLGVWVRSYWYFTGVRLVTGPPESYYVGAIQGQVLFSQWHYATAREGRWVVSNEPAPAELPPRRDREAFPGVRDGGLPGRHQWVSVSLAYPLFLFAILPALAARRAWRPRRPGLCRQCGYDLRATPGLCPECGTVTPVIHPDRPSGRGEERFG
jgi:hypothetical protein